MQNKQSKITSPSHLFAQPRIKKGEPVMFEKFVEIAFGSRAGILNRIFSALTILIILLQIWRYFQLSRRIRQWLYKLTQLEQEAREEGVVTVTDPSYLPPLDPYARVWDQVPSMALMFGLLGTFVGLTLSLSEIPVTIDVEAIRQGLSSAIPSMGTAFWTSLCGLIVAITVRITNGLLSSKFRREVIDKLLIYSEPEVLDALESAAYRMGRDGAILRPFGMRELLWHQNRLLGQTITRLAPQIAGILNKSLEKLTEELKNSNREQFTQLSQKLLSSLEPLQRNTEQQLHLLREQNRLLAQTIHTLGQISNGGNRPSGFEPQNSPAGTHPPHLVDNSGNFYNQPQARPASGRPDFSKTEVFSPVESGPSTSTLPPSDKSGKNPREK